MVNVVTGESSFVPYIMSSAFTCVTVIQILQIVGVAL